MAEHADRICVSAHHHVGEANVVVGCEMCSHNTGKHGLLIELNVIKGFQCKTEITKKTVDSQETNDGEISEHAVQGLGPVVACDRHGLLVALHRGQLFVDLGSLDEGVEDVEDGVAAPCVGCFAEDLDFLFVVALSRDAISVRAKRVELVDKLINDIPSPVILILKSAFADPVGFWYYAQMVVQGQQVPQSSR